MTDKQYSNALVNQTSPYLLQHAHNPVNWLPWGTHALQLAQEQNKPILLSIGYSACHWCHVMAHESFEDEATAELMNRHFINIKVDREERPDLDKIYQDAHHLLTRRGGGWPLTLFLHADNRLPFFAGTYFPPQSRHGLPAFKDLLQQVADYYKAEQEAIKEQNQALTDAMAKMQNVPAAASCSPPQGQAMEDFIKALSADFDVLHGGFGHAPKFPHPASLTSLLHYAVAAAPEQQRHSLHMVDFTLEKMALGGVYDHLAGGFCRYSVDERWMIPHFEKMLYDNGALLALYVEAWKTSGRQHFSKVVSETADWLASDMQAAAGGYYSSLDADSEGQEGRFYVWSSEEVEALLGEQEYAVFSRRFGFQEAANFDHQRHLYVSTSLTELGQALGLPEKRVSELLNSARDKLLLARNKRVHPGRDDKILTAWNALTIRAMALAAINFNREDWFCSAEQALQFLRRTLWQNGKLLATCKDGRAHLDAYLDDYAFLLDAILAVLSYRWSGEYLDFAIELADALLENFYDNENGGFFFTAHDHEELIQRRKDYADDALPAGNSIAAISLCKLAHLLGSTRYLQAAEHTVEAARGWMQAYPRAHASMLLAEYELRQPAAQLIIRGEAPELERWRLHAQQLADIRTRVYAIPADIPLPGSLQAGLESGATCAYLCQGFQCLPPFTRLQDIHFPESSLNAGIRRLNETSKMP